ncbi:hypothetical protein Aph01nite_12990 [Acrocarpospora phusangensis]|uniref:Holin n=1 Tax=Acrocarpospora phusangensis TaxID=1070424 RepID=A0A919Q866_9ACTN|nr:hypothetical protein [Acrocarpospora phusangensis]GIH22989.1 hypothetical protein Aph01nite_12990 [Acrocarpospora phusangensis]
MHGEPITYSRPPVEAKVKAMTFVQYILGVAGLAVLQVVDADHSLIEFLPDWLEAVGIPLIPTAMAAVAGYKARHTPRPDLPGHQR